MSAAARRARAGLRVACGAALAACACACNGGGGQDAGDGGDAMANACNDVTVSDTAVGADVSTEMLPEPAGGTVRDGTYDLVSEVLYGPQDGGVSPATVQITIVLSNPTYTAAQGAGAAMEIGANGAFSTSGVGFEFHSDCPTSVSTTYGFTTDGSQLTLYQSAPPTAFTFRRR